VNSVSVKKKKFPSSFAIGDLVEVVDAIETRVGTTGRDIISGTLGVVVELNESSEDYYVVHLPCGENQIMSYKWIRKVS
tara:strand:+ start:2329 stop:2565 length:237 start_codon:yes stop_codon:yes gene_type:complete